MVKKAILIAIAFIVFYSGFLYVIGPRWRSSQDQYQDNLIKAENFLFDFHDTTKSIIVGSSLSCRLIMDSIPGFFNLSFHGMSVSEGLNVLSLSKVSCKNIYVEMNVASKSENKEFISSLNSPLLFYPRKYVPVLREGKQPIGVVGTILAYQVFWKLRSKFSKQKKTIVSDSNTDFFSVLLDQTISDFSESPDEKLLTEKFEKIKSYISSFEKEGKTIIFFEMPVNKSVCDLNYPKKIRETFNEYFPDTKYLYISSPDCKDYKTTDGIHLGYDEALQYTLYFKKEVETKLSNMSKNN